MVAYRHVNVFFFLFFPRGEVGIHHDVAQQHRAQQQIPIFAQGQNPRGPSSLAPCLKSTAGAPCMGQVWTFCGRKKHQFSHGGALKGGLKVGSAPSLVGLTPAPRCKKTPTLHSCVKTRTSVGALWATSNIKSSYETNYLAEPLCHATLEPPCPWKFTGAPKPMFLSRGTVRPVSFI